MTGPLQPPPALENTGLCIFDCETTGLDPLQDEIIQAAWIITDFTGQEVRSESMVRILPTREVPPKVAAINGYDQKLWEREGVPLSQAMSRLLASAQQTIFVAHNVPFDWAFLATALNVCNMHWAGDYHRVDTVALAWPLLVAGAVPSVNLVTLSNFFGITAPTHDALADARACRGIYLGLMRLWRREAEGVAAARALGHIVATALTSGTVP